jgi:hypothetical protein
MSKSELANKIIHTLVISLFQTVDKPRTAYECRQQELRAFSLYYNDALFRNVVNKQAAIIMDLVNEYEVGQCWSAAYRAKMEPTTVLLTDGGHHEQR